MGPREKSNPVTPRAHLLGDAKKTWFKNRAQRRVLHQILPVYHSLCSRMMSQQNFSLMQSSCSCWRARALYRSKFRVRVLVGGPVPCTVPNQPSFPTPTFSIAPSVPSRMLQRVHRFKGGLDHIIGTSERSNRHVPPTLKALYCPLLIRATRRYESLI